MTRHVTLAFVFTLVAVAGLAAQEPADPHQWLEEVEGAKALQWVEAHNRASIDELKKYPAYDTLYQRILGAITSRDRIPNVSILGDHLYNFWTDREHPRGIWRRTTVTSYGTPQPVWETVIDVDSLAKAENAPWAWKGATCLEPEFKRCLINLSRGGADAVERREFDLPTKRFVANGFFVPQAKSNVSWIDANTLFVATDFGDGSMTTSGYPRIVKRWERGTPLASAKTVFEAKQTDMSAFGFVLRVAGRRIPMVGYNPKFFHTNYYILRDTLARFDLQSDADWYVVGDRLLVLPKTDWNVGGKTYKTGKLISIGFGEFMRGDRSFETVIAPTPRQSIEAIATTENLVLVTMLNNVRGELHRYRFTNAKWTSDRVPTPDMSTVNVGSTDDYSDRFFYSVTSFTQPTTLYYGEGTGAPRAVKQLPSMFKNNGVVTSQFEATSKDGTKVPYFIVHRENVKLDGTNPTLIYGYGGFEVTYTPGYNSIMGSSWLERGNIYVLAGIRGGGEYGPAWHKAAQLEKRQNAYDDFYAVAEDVITRGYTSPQHLGIMGGSNGGLLTGVAMTQRPELFNAVVIDVPLLDMRRYNKLLAGASWMAEYGDPDKPEDWAFISKYSPYHNLKPGVKYPRAMITTTTRDDRVHPGHARKMGAKLDELGVPYYYFENTEGGHGSGVTPEQQARMWAAKYAYLLKQLSSPNAIVQ